eukprot:c41677_g1_i1 orf=28-201(+)
MLLRLKLETLRFFEKCKLMVEKQVGTFIKVLWNGHGGEYNPHIFDDFWKSNGYSINS